MNKTQYEEIHELMTRSAAQLLWLALALCAGAALVTNVNPTGAVFYTLDGGDPSGHFGNVVTNARSYSEPVSVNYSLVIRARVKSGTNWRADGPTDESRCLSDFTPDRLYLQKAPDRPMTVGRRLVP